MLVRRLTIIILLVGLFATGLSAVVAETSHDRIARASTPANCGLTGSTSCIGPNAQRLER